MVAPPLDMLAALSLPFEFELNSRECLPDLLIELKLNRPNWLDHQID